jgi:hypothetical protein
VCKQFRAFCWRSGRIPHVRYFFSGELAYQSRKPSPCAHRADGDEVRRVACLGNEPLDQPADKGVANTAIADGYGGPGAGSAVLAPT